MRPCSAPSARPETASWCSERRASRSSCVPARVFVRTILQCVDYRYNVGLYAIPRDPRSQRAYAQVLFSYKVNPRTVWFVGYTDNRMGTDEYVLTQRDRTLFTKVGYAWRFSHRRHGTQGSGRISTLTVL